MIPGNFIMFLAGLYFRRRRLFYQIDENIPFFLAVMTQVVGAPALSLFYVSALTLLSRRQVWQNWLQYLVPAGRMALTNYLMQRYRCCTCAVQTPTVMSRCWKKDAASPNAARLNSRSVMTLPPACPLRRALAEASK